MNKANIVKYKENFITKIRKFLKRLFVSKKETNDNVLKSSVNENNKKREIEERDIRKDIKVTTESIDKLIEKKEFLEYIDGNIEALSKLSIDRLEKLKEYYNGIIEKNNKIISNLKQNL